MGFDVSKGNYFGNIGGFEAIGGASGADKGELGGLVAATGIGILSSAAVTTPAIDTTGAKFIVVIFSVYHGHQTLTDSKGNVWQALTWFGSGNLPPLTNNTSLQMFYCINPIVGPGHTFTSSAYATYGCCIAVLAFSHNIAAFDKEVNVSLVDAALTQCGSLVPVEAGELFIAAVAAESVVAGVGINSAFTIGWTNPNTANQYGANSIAYKKKISATSQAPIWSGISPGNGRGFAIAQAAFRVVGDAQAFITAAGISDPTQQSAITTLVSDLKAANLWIKMRAIYPIVGGNAAAHKFNLKDPRDLDAAYRLVFTAGWVHAATGITPTNARADTKFTASVNGLVNSSHLSVYVRTNTVAGTKIEIGAADGSTKTWIVGSRYTGDLLATDAYGFNPGAGRIQTANTDARGFYISNRTAAAVQNQWKNGLKTAPDDTHTDAIGLAVANVSIGDGSVIGQFSDREIAFASIGTGLTDADALALYTAVQKYQTTLGRAIVPPPTISPLTHTAAGSLDNNTVTTPAIDTTGAKLIVIHLTTTFGAARTISDSKGNVWAPLTEYGANSTAPSEQIYYCINPIVGTGHTFTGVATGNWPAIAVQSFANAAGGLDASIGTSNGTGVNSMQPGSLTPSIDGCLLVTSFAISGFTPSIGSGFTISDHSAGTATAYGVDAAYKIQTTKNAENPTWSITPAVIAAAAMAVFKPG